jgi:hypothetical protein
MLMSFLGWFDDGLLGKEGGASGHLPDLVIHHQTHVAGAIDGKMRRDFSEWHAALAHRSHFGDFLKRKPVVPVSFSNGFVCSSLGLSVTHVVGVRAIEKMGWVDARRRIAGVADVACRLALENFE